VTLWDPKTPLTDPKTPLTSAIAKDGVASWMGSMGVVVGLSPAGPMFFWFNVCGRQTVRAYFSNALIGYPIHHGS